LKDCFNLCKAIFGIALVVFGPKKLPELGKGIGEGIRGFKSAMKQQEKPANVEPIIAGAKADRGESWVLARSCC
jgi:TatA/E family protein of Tat protein translocase